MKKTLLYFLICMLSCATSLHAQNNIPDSLFGTNSILSVDPGPGGEVGSNLLLQPDGKIIYGGYDYDISVNGFYNDIVRFDECGNIDSAFGTNGMVHHTFEQRNMGFVYFLQPDGKILVGGIQSTSNAGSQQFPFIARYNADGSVDTNFATSGTNKTTFDGVSAGSIYSIDTMPDGRIVAIGTCNCGGGGVLRLNPDGSFDTTFDSDGKALHTFGNFSAFSEVYGHLLSNGKIVLAGATWDGSFIDHFVSYRFDSAGVLDTTYGVSGFFNDTTNLDVYTYGLSTAIQADEKLIIAANRPSLAGIEMLRLNSDGSIDTTFGSSGHVSIAITSADVLKIKILANGQIMIMGSGNGSSAFGELINPDGTIDSTFGTDGYRTFDLNNGSNNSGLMDLLVLANGKWLAATVANSMFQVVKFANQSNVPHVSFDGAQLHTTGSGTYQWYLNGNLLSGATSDVYTPSLNGTYTVALIDSSGCTYENDFVLSTLGIEVNDRSSFSVFPNPADNQATFNFSKNITVSRIRIADISGREIEVPPANKITGSSLTIGTAELSDGIYFVRITTEAETYVSEMIIRH